jgi:hypothetical protein
MKLNSFYPFVAGIFTAFLFVWIWACTQPAAPAPQKQAETAAPAILNDSLHWKDAQSDIAKWQTKRIKINKKLSDGDTAFVVKGFHVPVKDLKELFTALQNRQIDSVWAMMSIMKGKGGTQESNHLIFQALKKSHGASNAASTQYEYYDITTTCPINCPPE